MDPPVQALGRSNVVWTSMSRPPKTKSKIDPSKIYTDMSVLCVRVQKGTNCSTICSNQTNHHQGHVMGESRHTFSSVALIHHHGFPQERTTQHSRTQHRTAQAATKRALSSFSSPETRKPRTWTRGTTATTTKTTLVVVIVVHNNQDAVLINNSQSIGGHRAPWRMQQRWTEQQDRHG